MNKLALFSFVKNEINIIESFIEHHKNIFDEITIIDNGSTDGTYEFLKNISFINLFLEKSSFEKKGMICTRYMKESSCDLLLPLDADEKIIYDDNNIKTKNAFSIRNYLQNLPITGEKFKVKNIYEYHPDNDGFWDYNNHKKFIFPKNTFILTDDGFHRGQTTLDNPITFKRGYYWRNIDKYNDPIIEINISYLHYHFVSKEIWLKKTQDKLKQRIGEGWNDMNVLKEYFGSSRHLKREYLRYLKTGKWHILKKNIFIDFYEKH